MTNPSQPNHVDPSGFILPGEPFLPSNQEQRSYKSVTLYDATSFAGALLNKQESFCWVQGLLPRGYSLREPADFEEFFEAEELLAELELEMEAGTLEASLSLPLSERQIEAILATIRECQRLFDHTLSLSQRLRMRLMAACRTELRLLRKELHGVS